MQNTAAMLAFYRGLGFQVTENARACSVYIGDQMINFHQPATWQDAGVHAARSGGQASLRRSVLCVGRHGGRAEDVARSGPGPR